MCHSIVLTVDVLVYHSIGLILDPSSIGLTLAGVLGLLFNYLLPVIVYSSSTRCAVLTLAVPGYFSYPSCARVLFLS